MFFIFFGLLFYYLVIIIFIIGQQYRQAVILRASLNLWPFLHDQSLFCFVHTSGNEFHSQACLTTLLIMTSYDSLPLTHQLTHRCGGRKARCYKDYSDAAQNLHETRVFPILVALQALFRWNGRSSTEVSTSVPNRFPCCLFHISHFGIRHRQLTTMTRTNCSKKVCKVEIGKINTCVWHIDPICGPCNP